jgi:T5SS/PEP-CTERM-associated repeat protein/autotransporter-associated beta strand protein
MVVSGGLVSNDYGYVGYLTDGAGIATVTSGTWATSVNLMVGVFGNGKLEVEGGLVSNYDGYLGYDPNGAGSAIVTGGLWQNSSNLFVGRSGTGTLLVDGGMVSNYTASIGHNLGSFGSATVTSGTWATTDSLSIGYEGTGSLEVNGGLVSSASGYLGNVATGTGSATVTSGTWENSSHLHVGSEGAGSLVIDGGLVSNDIGFIGTQTGPNISSTATVTSGTWSNGSDLYVGYMGRGNLLVNGGLVSNSRGIVAYAASGTSSATVSSGTWQNTTALTVGASGKGVLNIAGSGVVTIGSGTGTLTLASGTGSQGTLNMGTGGAAGTLDAAVVTSGSGSASVNFNHTGTATFDPRLAGSLNVNKLGTGTTILTGSNSYTGATIVEEGTLLIMGDSSSSADFRVEDGGKLGGNGTVSDVEVFSGGTLAPGASPGLLTVEGDLTLHAGSTLVMEFTGTGAGEFDQIAIHELFTAGGTLFLDINYAAVEGDTFTIFTNGFTGRGWDTGSFSIDSDLGGGLDWDASALATTGVITIVPEPSTALLSAAGIMGLLALRRRRVPASRIAQFSRN